jgi:putative ribosome biogenesis GTPase RsgA
MVAKPTVLIKGTPTILGAKQIQQQEPDQQQQQINNTQPIIILSPNNTSAPATTPINTDMMVKKSPQLMTRVLQQQEGHSTPKSPIQPITLLNKAPSPTPQKVAQPNKCFKLLTENLEVLTEQVSKILSSTVNTEQQTSDFTVIGVLGEQGVGKSTILNELARVRYIYTN